MELRSGYKLTEVGVIPEDWECKRIHEAAANIGNAIVGGPFGSDLISADYVLAGIPVIRGQNMSEGLVSGDFVFVSPHKAKVLNANLAYPSDLVFTQRGTLGQVAIVPERPFGRYLISQSQMKVSLDRSRHDPCFVHQYFASHAGQKQIANSAIQTGVPHTNLGILRAYQFPAPPLPEQRAIAAALSDVDSLLEGLTRLIAKKRDLKQAAMQQLLTAETRLPGFHGEWEVKTLGDCLLSGPDYGINAAAVPFSDRLPTYIRITDISEQGRFCPDPKVSVQAANNDQYYLSVGDVVFARTGASVGKSYLYEPNDGPLVFAGFLIRVRPDPDYLIPKFLAAYSTTRPFWNWVRLMSVRSGQPGINGHEYAQLPLLLPAVPEQIAIASVLSDIDAELSALEARRKKTRALKQAMMQELLTGRTRLVVPAFRESRKDTERTDGRQANIHFKRSVLAAEIIDRLHDEPTFGHVKFEKMIFLVEHLCDVDTGSTYHRDAAGPYDNRAMRSIDSQLRKQKWFDAQKVEDRYRYKPMANRGKHKEYFERYFAGISAAFDTVIETFRNFTTERCEIVATLFAAWSDLLRQKGPISDDAIVNEVLHNWHESKKRIPEDRWRKALSWMRDHGFVPHNATGAV